MLQQLAELDDLRNVVEGLPSDVIAKYLPKISSMGLDMDKFGHPKHNSMEVSYGKS